MSLVNSSAATARQVMSGLFVFLLFTTAVIAQTGVGVAEVGKKTAEFSKYEQSLVDNVKVDSIKKYVSALAADDMEGRGTLLFALYKKKLGCCYGAGGRSR